VVTNFTLTHGPYRGRQLDDFCAAYPGECGALSDRDAFERDRLIYRINHLGFSFDFDNTVAKHGLSASDVERLHEVAKLLYKADVHQLDRHFGAVLQAVEERGLLDEAIVVFTADHGEIHYRENAPFRWTHGFALTPEVLEVPLVVWGPGVDIEASRYESVTRSIDVAPTLVGLAGLGALRRDVSLDVEDDDTLGRDLSRAVLGHETAPSLVALSHTAMFPPRAWKQYASYETLASHYPSIDPALMWVAARRGDRVVKLRRLPGQRFRPVGFDWSRDRAETTELAVSSVGDEADLLRRAERYKSGLVSGYPRRSARSIDPRDEERRLRALGYIE
jgi:arylsulfatase A-like enzyme